MKRNLEKVVLKDRKQRMRIRSIVKHLQRLSINDGQLSLVILEDVIYYLKKNNMPYSDREVYAAFKLIPKNEYTEDSKNEEINKWSRDAQKGSVFTKIEADLKPCGTFQGRFHAFKVINYTQKLRGSQILSNQHLV